jgi:hypothetical protein
MVEGKIAYPFPGDNINPKLKSKKEYCLSFAKAIDNDYNNGISYLNLNSRFAIRGLRAYGNGRQDVRKYVTLLLGIDEDKAHNKTTADLIREGYMNINGEILSVAPKFKTLIMQLFEEIEHDVFADAVDGFSVNTKEAAMFNLWAKKMLRQEIEEINAMIGVVEDEEPYIPESLDELSMMQQSGYFKLSTEQAIEVAIKYTLEISRWKEVKRQLIEDLFEQHLACSKTVYDPVFKKYKNKYVDIENLVVSHATGNTLDNFYYIGEYEKISIATLKTLLDSEGHNEEFYEAIAKSVFNMYDNNRGALEFSAYNAFNDVTGNYPYDSFLIYVLNCEYKTADTENYIEKTNQFGRNLIFEKKFKENDKSEKSKYIKSTVEMWYKCSWIVGTEICYNYGLANDIVRPKEFQAESSYKIYRIPGKSKLEQMVVHLDLIQMTYMKLQNAIAKAKPAGVAVEVNSLMNITIGVNKLTPLEIFSIYNQTGSLLYKQTATRAFTPNNNGGKPITELQGGIGNQLDEFMSIIASELNIIRDITGITQPLDATQPTSQQGLGVTEIAMTSATKALGFIYTAYIDIKERICNDTWNKIANKISVSNEAYEVYEKNIGATNTKLLLIDKKIIGDTKCNIYIKAKASKEQAARIILAATESMKASKNGYGGISSSDLIMIERILDSGNIKLAEMMLAKKERDAEIRRLKEAEANTKANAESQQVFEAQKHRQNIEKLQAEIQKLQAETELKKQSEIELETLKHQNKMAEIRLTMDLQNEGALMQTIQNNKTNNKTK